MPSLPAFRFHHPYADDRRRRGITVPVCLICGESVVEVIAKVDTGTEFCLFERSVGEELGLKMDSGVESRLSTLGGSLAVYGHEVTMQTFDYQFESFVYFAQDPGINRNFLGRNGWLEHFRVAIVHYDRDLYLSPYE